MRGAKVAEVCQAPGIMIRDGRGTEGGKGLGGDREGPESGGMVKKEWESVWSQDRSERVWMRRVLAWTSLGVGPIQRMRLGERACSCRSMYHCGTHQM
jgi:hypothetical protein